MQRPDTRSGALASPISPHLTWYAVAASCCYLWHKFWTHIATLVGGGWSCTHRLDVLFCFIRMTQRDHSHRHLVLNLSLAICNAFDWAFCHWPSNAGSGTCCMKRVCNTYYWGRECTSSGSGCSRLLSCTVFLMRSCSILPDVTVIPGRRDHSQKASLARWFGPPKCATTYQASDRVGQHDAPGRISTTDNLEIYYILNLCPRHTCPPVGRVCPPHFV